VPKNDHNSIYSLNEIERRAARKVTVHHFLFVGDHLANAFLQHPEGFDDGIPQGLIVQLGGLLAQIFTDYIRYRRTGLVVADTGPP